MIMLYCSFAIYELLYFTTKRLRHPHIELSNAYLVDKRVTEICCKLQIHWLILFISSIIRTVRIGGQPLVS
jgi:hypothetical protein